MCKTDSPDGIASIVIDTIAELAPSKTDWSPETDLRLSEDLGFDSIGVIRLIIAIEERMGVEFGDDSLTPETFATVSSVVQYTLLNYEAQCVAGGDCSESA